MAGTRVLGIGGLNGVDSYSSPSCERIVRTRRDLVKRHAEQYLKLWFGYWFHICVHIDVNINVHVVVVGHGGAELLRHCFQVGSHVQKRAGEELLELCGLDTSEPTYDIGRIHVR